VWVQRGVALACVGVVVVSYTQLMPGGLLSDTSLGQVVQGIARTIARSVAAVNFPASRSPAPSATPARETTYLPFIVLTHTLICPPPS